MKTIGKIYLVGAGPGDPELLTVKAHRLIRQARVVLYDDLVSEAIVSLAGCQCEVVNVGKRCGAKRISQHEINARMIESARGGLSVVRLKSGDPGIFGRLAEEMDALDAAGIPYEVVPGITAGIAAAASLSVSLTDRRKSARVVIVTGHKAYAGQKPQKIDWKILAREDATLIVYMPGHEFSNLRAELLEAGLPGAVPAVVVSRATAQDQRHQYTTVGDLDSLPRLESPSILLMGWSLQGAGEKSRTIDYAELMLASE
ncbi:MAG: uroporphyrinogen-III C-methyltransferase [Candidatus Acidiferrales bacterium]|jgi:uroporphyrin-III C-methyltransferase